MTCIELMRRCQRNYNGWYKHHSDGALTQHQVRVLSALLAHPNLTQTELMRFTHFDRSTLSAMLDVLETQGKIKRNRNREDQRTNRMRITAQGRAALRLADAAAHYAERALFNALSPTEKTTLEKLLDKVARNACQIS